MDVTMTGGTVHAIFECTVCGTRWENYLTAQECARTHARESGHVVRGEVGIVYEYDGTS